MKKIILISSCLLLMVSCHQLNNEEPELNNEKTALINNPVKDVKLTVSNETFTIGFNADYIKNVLCLDVRVDDFAKLKTRDDLINFYKTLTPLFQKSYSSMSDINEFVFVKVEYLLAQECFSDKCDSKIRKEVLQLVTNYQKHKYEEYTYPCHTQKTGVFLMAVILIKEIKNSIKFVDTTTLQKALLCLNTGDYISEDFSKLLIESSELFIKNN